MSITRRVFLRNGAPAVVGTTAIPSFLTRAAYSAVEIRARNKRLVVIFQRGAADGLNIVVPHGEQAYYAMRPSINIPRNTVIDLDGFLVSIPRCQLCSPYGISAISPSYMRLALLTQAVLTSMRKTLWNPALLASRPPKTAG